MRQRIILVMVLSVSLSVLSLAQTKETKPAAGHAGVTHKMITPEKVVWTHPPNFPDGFDLAVIGGDPSTETAFTIRIKGVDGAIVPPHWHPTDENITVVKGTFLLGTGDKFDKAGLHPLSVGSYSFMPKEMCHFGQCQGETVVQVHGIGPFRVIYVNPADDPANKTSKK